MSKIYFAVSISGGRKYASAYPKLIKFIKGHAKLLNEYVGDQTLTNMGESSAPKFIHDRDIDWLFQADALIVEATAVSMGVGYEVGRWVQRNVGYLSEGLPQDVKPFLILYRHIPKTKLTAMLAGIPHQYGVTVARYKTFKEAKTIIEDFAIAHNLQVE